MSKKVLVVALFVIVVGAAFAKADTVVDPRIVISEPACQQSDTDVTQLNAGFVVIPISGGGSFGFCNKVQVLQGEELVGVNWTSLLMVISTTAPASSIECPSNNPSDPFNQAHLAFASCVPIQSQTLPNVVYLSFSGIGPIPVPGANPNLGVPYLNRFTVDLNCLANTDCAPWPEGTIMAGYANFNGTEFPPPPSIPEPASLSLLGVGLGAVALRRKFIQK
jgi:PEP-CTERM motif